MSGKDLADLILDTSLRAALEVMRDRLTAGFDIDRIILFGSAVWGQPDGESDVDILIVLKDRFDIETENLISQVIFDINLVHETNLSELIVDRQTWDRGLASAMPIHDEIEQRGIPL